MELATIKAEIKAWERSFKAKYSRAPSIEDIKRRPDIAAKYKLYKNITKQSGANQREKDGAVLPSTPPRQKSSLPGPSSLILKSRATQGALDPLTPNPFSPVKSSHRRQNNNTKPLQVPTLPTTPPRGNFANRQSLSPDPFPPFETTLRSLTPEHSPSERSTVKRARKRLRGDAVSPTPSRMDKKRRTATIRSYPSFQTRSHIDSRVEPRFDDDEEVSFIDESPVKVTSQRKDFKVLFDEGSPLLDFDGPRARTSKKNSTARSDFPTSDYMDSNLLPRDKALPKQVVAMGSRLNSIFISRDSVTDIEPTLGTLEDQLRGPKRDRKRSSSDAEISNAKKIAETEEKLLPPSPPPTSATLPHIPGRGSKSTKGLSSNRKRTKLAPDDQGYPSEEDEQMDVRIYEAERDLRKRTKPINRISDDDPDLEISTLATDRYGQLSAEGETSEGEELEISLPDSLRSVLHISPSRAREREERALVDSLLLGEANLDKYGEVWGVGEVDLSKVVTDDEDDWAGEGVPWEAAEM